MRAMTVEEMGEIEGGWWKPWMTCAAGIAVGTAVGVLVGGFGGLLGAVAGKVLFCAEDAY